jgi:hypothetical protein
VYVRLVMMARNKRGPMFLDIEARSGSVHGIAIGLLAPGIGRPAASEADRRGP